MSMTTRIKKDGAFYAKTGPDEVKPPRKATSFHIDNDLIVPMNVLLNKRKEKFARTSMIDLINEGCELILQKENIPFNASLYYKSSEYREGSEL